ncbi:unnamed protein product, partial [Adineta steineri]
MICLDKSISSIFVPNPCFNSTNIGINCDISSTPCSLLGPCENDGICICNKTSNTKFIFICTLGYEGRRWERRINYCSNINCHHHGICRLSLTDYVCHCFNGRYGQNCELITKEKNIYQIISKSIAYVAIIGIVSEVSFVIIMDILKYGFGIDPTRKTIKYIRKQKSFQNRKRIIQR